MISQVLLKLYGGEERFKIENDKVVQAKGQMEQFKIFWTNMIHTQGQSDQLNALAANVR